VTDDQHPFDRLARAWQEPLPRRRLIQIGATTIGAMLLSGIPRGGKAHARDIDRLPQQPSMPAQTLDRDLLGYTECTEGPYSIDCPPDYRCCPNGGLESTNGAVIGCCAPYEYCGTVTLAGKLYRGCNLVCSSNETPCNGSCCRQNEECRKATGPEADDTCEPRCVGPSPRCGERCCEIDEKCIGMPGNPRCVACRHGQSGCGDVCCQRGEICDPATLTCCEPEVSQGGECVVVTQECAAQVHELVDKQITATCQRHGGGPTNLGGMSETGFFSLGCYFNALTTLRRVELSKCPTTFSDAVCGLGRRCDTRTGTCKPAQCRPSAQKSVDAEPLIPFLVAEPYRPEDARVTRVAAPFMPDVDALIGCLHDARPRIDMDTRRLVRTIGRRSNYATVGVAPSVLVALSIYRRDLRSLRHAVHGVRPASARGQRGRRALLTTLDLTDRAVREVELSVVRQGTEAVRHSKRSRSALRKARRAARQARRALGCGEAC
jgi:hypothetical protein